MNAIIGLFVILGVSIIGAVLSADEHDYEHKAARVLWRIMTFIILVVLAFLYNVTIDQLEKRSDALAKMMITSNTPFPLEYKNYEQLIRKQIDIDAINKKYQ